MKLNNNKHILVGFLVCCLYSNVMVNIYNFTAFFVLKKDWFQFMFLFKSDSHWVIVIKSDDRSIFPPLKNSNCCVCNQWPESKIITFAFHNQNPQKQLSFFNLFLHKILDLSYDQEICNFVQDLLWINKIFYDKMLLTYIILNKFCTTIENV